MKDDDNAPLPPASPVATAVVILGLAVFILCLGLDLYHHLHH